MKKILTMLALAVAALAPAHAQQYAVSTAYSSSTNSIGTNATVTNNVTISATKVADIGLGVTARGASGATGNITATFARSLDGTNWVSSPTITVAVPLSGTNVVTAVTNITLGAVGYLRLNTVANGDPASVATNVAVKVAKKPLN